jgi:hypothetical protein
MRVIHFSRLVVALGLIGLPLQAANASAILPPNAYFAGDPIQEWTAAWWTWALQSPADTNPLLDTTGAFANVNNDGPVFFVAGNTATRSFQVPGGKPILFPLINFFDVEPVPPDPPEATLGDRKKAADLVVNAWVNVVDPASLFALIDGNAVANPTKYFEETGYFTMGPVQPGSLLEAFGVPAGTDAFPTKSAGYWLMVNGLAPGPHELRFGGASGAWSVDTGTPIGIESGGAFSTDTIDNITRVQQRILALQDPPDAPAIDLPEPGSLLLILSALLGLVAIHRRSKAA